MESRNDYGSSSPAARLAPSDPIAAAIGLLRPHTVEEASLRAAGSWALTFAGSPRVEFGVVAGGSCWLTLEGHESVLLEEGDFFLLSAPSSYVLTSSLTEQPMDAPSSWRGCARVGAEGEEDTYLCGGSFAFDDANEAILLSVIPPLVHVPAASPRGTLLTHLSQLLVAEVEFTGVGRTLVLDHLAQILLVHMLRAHADAADRPTGWLGALNDDGIGAALRAMHADVSHRWTLQQLAAVSRMSRSAFAASFRRRVGTAPLDYLIEWRMSLARDALRRGTRSISELARATGYESESAFSTAFRRVVGISPSRFRDQAVPS